MSDKELQNEKEKETAENQPVEQPTEETAAETPTENPEVPEAPAPEKSGDDSEGTVAEETTPEETVAEDTSEEKAEEAVEVKEEKTTEEKVEEPAASEPQEETEAEEEAQEEVAAPQAKEEESEEKEESEEEEIESSDEEHEAPLEEEEDVDYHSLSKEELISHFQKLLKEGDVQKIKNSVEEIKTEFNAKFAEELQQKKDEFLAEGGNIIDFHYTTPLKKQFNSLYFDYKEKRNNYYQNLKRDLQANFKKREELIEELKGLLNAEENINTTYRHFKDIQERWHTAGPIPRDKYNTVWNTYRHHVENFYDFLHLNREFRDLDFKHNLEQKLKLIGRAEELAQEVDLSKAFRELQMLHKMWKEDIGPVAKEFREDVWEKFSAATKIIHEKRQDYLKEQESQFEDNYNLKNEIVTKINEVTQSTHSSHKAWQNGIKEVQKLRDAYFEVGKVPRSKAKEIWNTFKEATRGFNREKNSFYKNQKKEQYTNLEKKLELIKIAEENKDSDDFEVITPLMKKIQSDWKSIGHVPRKESDKIWKQFKDACNHYFDRVHAERNEANKEEMAHFEAKETLLNALEGLEMSGDHNADLETIKGKIAEWKAIGRVPFNKRNIERKFNKVLDGLFGKLNLGKQEAEMIRFENKLSTLASQEDRRKLQNEEFFISKKINEVQQEIRQLENNLGFFQNAKEDNPFVKDVHNNINKHKEQLALWKTKLQKIRSLRKKEE
ncbi:DUF349 domain-containing protein [Aureisphaera galaxeae]|uniref:DUF349 domain-containing protein n=1 Tax=Aureisphaera galaxeae TaxID=1538023 RepID=UPI00234FE596|nr:DUF349 domain-containing protein [Aureisphaera galaxeae]MDC8003450.1 DUF349 domain-containing protein [Aureisphaera galaxeae]